MPETLATYNARNLNDPSSALFSTGTVVRMSQEGENNFAITYPCLLKRISLATVSGTSTYTLPDDVKSIRRVTWLGFKCDPLPQRNFREVFQNATQTGRPYWYVFNNIGQNLIQLFPAANATLSSTSSNLFGSEIPNRFIIEYYCAPDFTTYTIPSYIKRRLLKSYILRGCFNLEGAGQNLRASKYFNDRWKFLKDAYGMLLSDLHGKPRKLVINDIMSSSFYPGFPTLPIDRFGMSVERGE